MKVKIDELKGLIQKGAEKFVSHEEADYFAGLYMDAHFRKSPRMNPVEEALADLKVWKKVRGRNRGQVESAGKSRQRAGGESPPHGNG